VREVYEITRKKIDETDFGTKEDSEILRNKKGSETRKDKESGRIVIFHADEYINFDLWDCNSV
jgi:hypothetical protein